MQGNIATRALNDRTNSYNRRKLRVNAQVTAMFSSLEFFGNVTIIILLALTSGTTFLSLMHGMIFYAILLPHAFLMNTSFNKNRIIDYGWKCVFSNLIGKSTNNLDECNTNNAVNTDPIQSNQRKHRKKQRNSESDKVFVTQSSLPTLNSETIQENTTLPDSIACFNELTPSEIRVIRQHRHANELVELDVYDLEEEDCNLHLLRKLISNIQKEIWDERKYIANFKQLVAFVEGNRQGKVTAEFDPEDALSIKYNGKKTTQNKLVDGKRKKPRCFVNQESREALSSYIFNEQDKTDITNATTINLRGEVENRITMRKEVILELSSSLGEREKCFNLIEKLIDLEEGFVQEPFSNSQEMS